jgi:hypothetical protein
MSTNGSWNQARSSDRFRTSTERGSRHVSELVSWRTWRRAAPPRRLGRATRAQDDPIDCAYDGQHTEFPGTVRICRDSALQALSEFMGTGVRPECIGWEET